MYWRERSSNQKILPQSLTGCLRKSTERSIPEDQGWRRDEDEVFRGWKMNEMHGREETKPCHPVTRPVSRQIPGARRLARSPTSPRSRLTPTCSTIPFATMANPFAFQAYLPCCKIDAWRRWKKLYEWIITTLIQNQVINQELITSSRHTFGGGAYARPLHVALTRFAICRISSSPQTVCREFDTKDLLDRTITFWSDKRSVKKWFDVVLSNRPAWELSS